jgi:hypothetical protein
MMNRGVMNVEELANAVALDPRFNLSIVEFEDVPPDFQIRTFATADIVIAVHGNALTNILFMGSGSVVIEILPYKFAALFFLHIAKRLSVNYIPIVNEGVNGTAIYSGGDFNVTMCENVASVDMPGNGYCSHHFKNAPVHLNVRKITDALSTAYELVTRTPYIYG